MKIIVFVILGVLNAVSAVSQNSIDRLLKQHNSHSVSYISVEELRALQLNDSILILDAREADEFKTSRLQNAYFIGYNNFSIDDKKLKTADKNALIVVYCSLGIRSEKIGEKLQQAGFTKVKNLYGGIFNWKNKEFPIVNSKGEKTENIHGFSKHWSQYLKNGNIKY
ncbi:MAG: rhodanese [Aequorivita sp.]|nr:rhodanese [Aequorivita sp.]|tara:strand:- start:10074 stop:10574 length:501 start_codon:yes stop_codon:yes gene_type:complete